MTERRNSILGGTAARELYGKTMHVYSGNGWSATYHPRKSGAGILYLTSKGSEPIEYNAPGVRRYIRKNKPDAMMRDIGRTITEYLVIKHEYYRIAEYAKRIDDAAKPYVDDPAFLEYIEKQEAIYGASDYTKMTLDNYLIWIDVINKWANK